jgi:SAM-dependent MidA family methyltransferase
MLRLSFRRSAFTLARSMSDVPLADRIAGEIAENGPIPFSRFMELALFDRQEGYYASGRAAIGARGDFYTNVSVGRIFGRTLSSQFEEMWIALGRPDPFIIVEQGAHDGRFAADVLDAVNAFAPGLAGCLFYHIVEPFEPLRQRQKATLAAHSRRAAWFRSLNELPSFTGVHFTNEFVDALPVRLVNWKAGAWREFRVDHARGGFELIPTALDDPTLVANLPSALPDGYTTEVRPAADNWLTEVAGRLDRGFILIVDYGFPRDRFYAPFRAQGTLSCYRGHQRDSHPLIAPGSKDITAHVEFTALAEAARHLDLDVSGFTDQYHFLVGAAEPILAAAENAPHQTDRRSLGTLLHPETMGTQFKYLCLKRRVHADLSGFRYARPPTAELGI